MVDEFPAGPGAGLGWPAGAGRHWPPGGWSSKRMPIRSGLFCGSIYWVLLVSGRVSVPKPLSQIQRGTRRLLQGLSPRTSFGWIRGLGWTLEAYARYQTGAEVFFAASSVLFALFIFWRKSADRFGWLVAFAFVGFGASMGVEADRALVLAEPSWRGLHNLAQAAAYTTLVLFLYLFPNGSFAHRWARPVLPVLAALRYPLLRSSSTSSGRRRPPGCCSYPSC